MRIRARATDMTALSAALLAAGFGPVACGPPAIDGGFDSANPASRMYAIEDAVREAEGSRAGRGSITAQDKVPHLIEQLESDDPATRMMAIAALERLTGETLGYEHSDPLADRLSAVAQWREAYAAGRLAAHRASDPSRDGAASHD